MQIIKTRKRKKTAKWALLMAAAMALPAGAAAQGGLLQRGVSDEEYYGGQGMVQNRSGSATGLFTNQHFGNHVQGDDITNQTFGTPVGSGLFIMLAAGAGYAALKNKKRNKTNKTLKNSK